MTYEDFAKTLVVRGQRGHEGFVLDGSKAHYATRRTTRDVVVERQQAGLFVEALARDVFCGWADWRGNVVVVGPDEYDPYRLALVTIKGFLAQTGGHCARVGSKGDLWCWPPAEDRGRLHILPERALAAGLLPRSLGARTITRLHVFEMAYLEPSAAELCLRLAAHSVPLEGEVEFGSSYGQNTTGRQNSEFQQLVDGARAVPSANGYTLHVYPDAEALGGST